MQCFCDDFVLLRLKTNVLFKLNLPVYSWDFPVIDKLKNLKELEAYVYFQLSGGPYAWPKTVANQIVEPKRRNILLVESGCRFSSTQSINSGDLWSDEGDRIMYSIKHFTLLIHTSTAFMNKTRRPKLYA